MDTSGQRLWITVNRLVTNALNLVVNTSGGGGGGGSPAPATNLLIYVDSLTNGFQNWSWATNVNVSNFAPVYSGP